MKIKTLFSAVLLHTASLLSQETWTNTGADNNWGTATNWNPNTIPNGTGVTVTFPDLATNQTVILNNLSPTVGTITFSGTTKSYTIQPSGSNTLTFNTPSGNAAVTITNTTLPASSITAPITLSTNLTVTQNSTNNFTFGGAISGPGAVTIGGTGTTVFGAINTYTGTTTISSGATLSCSVASALPATAVTNSGTLALNGNNQSVGALSGSGNIQLGAATLTTTTSTSTTYSGLISGTGTLLLAGSGGTLILTGTSNSYTGGTTISGSTLQLGNSTALPPSGASPAGSVTVNSPGVLNLANFSPTIGALSGSGSVTLGSGTLTVNSGTSSSFTGVISGTGGLTVTQTGGTTLTLGGNNTYSGTTSITSGTLSLSTSNALYAGLLTPGAVIMSGSATLDISPSGSTTQTIGPLTGIATNRITLGSAQLVINESASSTFGGVISGAGSLALTGTATLTLTNSNTFTGGTTVDGGTLQLSAASNSLAPTGNLAINAPGMVALSASDTQTVGNLTGNGVLSLGAASTMTVTPTMSSLFSGVITGPGALTVAGTSPLILTGMNNYSGGTTVNPSAILQGTTTSLQGSITDNGTLIFNQTSSGTFSGTLSGTGTLLINGGGDITFNSPQQITTTSITAGELILTGGPSTTLTSTVTVGSGGALGGNGKVVGTVNNYGTLQLGLNTFTVTDNYNQNAGSYFVTDVTPSSSGLLTVGGTVTISSPATMDIDVVKGVYAASQLYTLITSSTAPVAGTFDPPVFDNPFFEGSLIYNAIAPGSVQLLLSIAPFSNVIVGGNAGEIAKCINLEEFPVESEFLPIINALIFLPIEEVRKALNEMQPSQLKSLAIAEENNFVLVRTAISQRQDDIYKTPCNLDFSEMYNWNIWGNVSGDYFIEESRESNPGFDVLTGTATIGIDTAMTDYASIGAAGAYGYSWLDWKNSKGHAKINSFYVGPYFTMFKRRIAWNVSALGTLNQFNASRHIDFPTVNRHATSSHSGYGFMGHSDLGAMCYPANDMSMTPFIGLDYIHLHESGYTEKGAGSLSLKIESSHSDLWRTDLGFKFAKCAIWTRSKWTHDFKLSWIHQFFVRGKHLTAQFQDVDCFFTVQGMTPNTDYVDVATGLTGVFRNDKVSLALRYEGKFGDGLCDNTAYFQLLVRF